jgi:DNA-binding NarL/FixJ family response regulator
VKATTILVVEPGLGLTRWMLAKLRGRASVDVRGPVPDALAAMRALELGPVDLVLVDADGPDPGAVIVDLVRLVPGVKVLAVTVADDDIELASASLTAGACGILTRSIRPAELEDALDRALASELVLPSMQLRALLGQVASVEHAGDERRRLVSLTTREREVLALLAEGCSTSEIASRLGISVGTVQAHVKSVLGKLGVHSKLEAIRLAWRHRTLAVPA